MNEVQEQNLVARAIGGNKQFNPDQIKQLLMTFSQEAIKGSIKWDKNLTESIEQAISQIDAVISKQLSSIMHQAKFAQLEGTWRGLQYFVKNTVTSELLKIKVLNSSQAELTKDLNQAMDFDQSQLFKKVYEEQFGSAGGEPFGILVGDYYFNNSPVDIETLQQVSNVAAAAFCPFISAAYPGLFGFNNWQELSVPHDLSRIFESPEYATWRGFRDSEDSRFVTLVLPRTLARLPYGKATLACEEFSFEELAPQSTNAQDDFCWMNSAFVHAGRITEAFALYGWCTAIRGAEGGGKVENLPIYSFKGNDGDIEIECPTETPITDRREAEISKLGFLPLCYYQNTDYSVFFGAQTTQAPAKYDNPEATANAAISARLPCVLATSRIAHYLKIMARDKIGSFMETKDVEAWLNTWVNKFVDSDPSSGQALKAQYPLAEAKVSVTPIAGEPGRYNVIAWLRPWLQLESLTASLRLVAKVPNQAQ